MTDSLSALFERYARLVFTIANRLLADPNEAEEVVQECFLYVFQRAHLFDESKGTGRTWLVGVAYYRAFDRRSARELAHRELEEELVLRDDGPNFAPANRRIPAPGALPLRSGTPVVLASAG